MTECAVILFSFLALNTDLISSTGTKDSVMVMGACCEREQWSRRLWNGFFIMRRGVAVGEEKRRERLEKKIIESQSAKIFEVSFFFWRSCYGRRMRSRSSYFRLGGEDGAYVAMWQGRRVVVRNPPALKLADIGKADPAGGRNKITKKCHSLAGKDSCY